MKKALLLVIAALMVPSIALAAKPAPAAKGGKGGPKVVYVLKGKLSAYSAYNAPTNGSITIVVSHANYHGKALRGMTLTFPLDAKSKISLENGLTTITDNDNGIVKVKAAKNIAAANLAATLQAIAARQVVDQRASG